MSLKLLTKDWVLVIGCALVVLLVGLGLRQVVSHDIAILVAIAALVLVLMLNLQVAYRRIEDRVQLEGEQRNKEFRQVESLLALYSYLRPPQPLPQLRGWVASPDFLAALMRQVLEQKPTTVVEASSGMSTVTIAHCLQKLGNGGKVYSLEHEAEYAEKTRQLVASHGLSDIVTVIHAPLVATQVGGESFDWYQTTGLPEDIDIDLLVVDGPPSQTSKLVRYPAVPALYDRFSSNAVVMLDDGARVQETETARRWAAEHSDLSSQYLPLEKGAFILKRG